MTYEFAMTAEAMLPAPHLPWWRRWALKLLRHPLPAPQRPEGTVPMMFENRNADGTTTRFFYPAARIQPLPAVPMHVDVNLISNAECAIRRTRNAAVTHHGV